MTFIQRVTQQSVSRSNRWHGGDFRNWNGLEWAAALCGEAGEVANVCKKLKRLDDGIAGNAASERPLERDALKAALAGECADVFLYLTLVAARFEIDLTAAVTRTFNKKSEAMGFPERL